MKTNKIIAGVLSICIIGGAMPLMENVLPQISIPVNAAEEYIRVTYGNMTYEKYSEHAALIICDRSTVGEVIIPEEIDGLPVTLIDTGAFESCKDLTSVIIPGSVTKIEGWAFENCKSLTSITIPDSVTSIGGAAFSFCESLTSIVIPDSVTSIGSVAFSHCENLTSITISKNIKEIGTSAFTTTPWLMNKRNENPLVIVNGILVDGLTYRGDLTVPEDVTCIGNSAFSSCQGLTSVTLPENVTRINGSAFSYCGNLTSIIIENPKCEIFDSNNTIFNIYHIDDEEPKEATIIFDGTIYGYAGSTAQAYAKKYERNFEILLQLGDVDFDGKVDSSDASRVLAEYALTATGHESTFTEKQKKSADVNKDGKVDSSDASSILAYYAYKATGGKDSIEKYLGK